MYRDQMQLPIVPLSAGFLGLRRESGVKFSKRGMKKIPLCLKKPACSQVVICFKPGKLLTEVIGRNRTKYSGGKKKLLETTAEEKLCYLW